MQDQTESTNPTCYTQFHTNPSEGNTLRAPRPTHLFYHIIEENDLCQFHCQIVLIGARLQIAHDRGSDTQRRHQESCQDQI